MPPGAAGSWTVEHGTLRGGQAGDDAGVLAALAALTAAAWSDDAARQPTASPPAMAQAEQALARLALAG